MPTTTQLAPPLLHAQFVDGVLVWELRRGDVVDRDGAFPSNTADPLRELRGLELRIGAAGVVIPKNTLTGDERAYCSSRGWALI